LTGEHGVKSRWLRWLCEQTLCRVTRHRCQADTNPYGEMVCIDCSRWLSWKEADRATVIGR
jgi:hypothetical protein